MAFGTLSVYSGGELISTLLQVIVKSVTNQIGLENNLVGYSLATATAAAAAAATATVTDKRHIFN